MSRPSFGLPGVAGASELSRESLERHTQLLHEIVAQTGRDRDVQIMHVLEQTAALLKLEQGLLSRVTGGTYTVEHCQGPERTLEVGDVLDLQDVCCSITLEKDCLYALADATEGDAQTCRCCEPSSVKSYIGVPVYADEALYGTLCFSGKHPRHAPFTKADESLVHLLGKWTGSMLEQRASERAHYQNEERLRLLAENVSDLVCLHSLEGDCIYASPSAERVVGYTDDELVGISPFELAHPDDAERIRSASLRMLRGEPDVTERARLRHADGSYRWYETVGHPVYDANDEERVVYFLSSTRDVSQRVETEEALQRTNAELRLRNRELQDFAHIASHDLQEPLRKVRAFAELMREDYTDAVDETGRYYLERMEDGAQRMSRLVSDLLSLSRVTTKGDPFEPIDLEALAAQTRTDLEMRIEETDGRVDIGTLPALDADPAQMRRLLQNLIGNALKFHREGVPPVVSVSGTREPASNYPDAGVAPGTEEIVCLVVEDNGIGFEEKFLDRIFTPLQRLNGRDAYDGTGIGLAVCRRIAERHGGDLHAESIPGAGSRFTARLPATQTDTNATQDADSSLAQGLDHSRPVA